MHVLAVYWKVNLLKGLNKIKEVCQTEKSDENLIALWLANLN